MVVSTEYAIAEMRIERSRLRERHQSGTYSVSEDIRSDNAFGYGLGAALATCLVMTAASYLGMEPEAVHITGPLGPPIAAWVAGFGLSR